MGLPCSWLVLSSLRQAALRLHDVVCGKQIAKVLTGGDVRPGTVVTEQHLLDLEKEGFVSMGTKLPKIVLSTCWRRVSTAQLV